MSGSDQRSSRRSNKRQHDDEDRPYREKHRGYQTHDDRNIRRRVVDDRRSHRDNSYYGRGYRLEQRPIVEDERDWRCMECGICNYDTDERCGRCGTFPRNNEHRHRAERHESTRRNDIPFSCHHSEGRHANRRSESPPEQADTRASKPWPPPFEAGGAEYVFDARSGMFYENMSDFYFDPKSKFYYGNKQKTYYTYRGGEDPPFVPFSSGQEEATGAGAEDAAAPPAARTKEEKPRIAITLKTTSLPGEKDAAKEVKNSKKTKAAAAPPVNRSEKQHSANMDKWSERVREIRGNDGTKTAPTTSKGQPVCLLCRRKFATIEKLKQHEELSKLHKENMAKKKNADDKKEQESATASAEYRDRVLERRIMHGPEPSTALPRELDVPEQRDAELVRPESSLGTANVGNQMLQKLGWKAGASLGRNAGNDSPAEGGQDHVQTALVKEWEKIESLAASGRQPPSKTNRGGLGSGF